MEHHISWCLGQGSQSCPETFLALLEIFDHFPVGTLLGSISSQQTIPKCHFCHIYILWWNKKREAKQEKLLVGTLWFSPVQGCCPVGGVPCYCAEWRESWPGIWNPSLKYREHRNKYYLTVNSRLPWDVAFAADMFWLGMARLTSQGHAHSGGGVVFHHDNGRTFLYMASCPLWTAPDPPPTLRQVNLLLQFSSNTITNLRLWLNHHKQVLLQTGEASTLISALASPAAGKATWSQQRYLSKQQTSRTMLGVARIKLEIQTKEQLETSVALKVTFSLSFCPIWRLSVDKEL